MQLLWVIVGADHCDHLGVLDRKRTSYRQLYYWLRIVIRYYFAYILIAYGFVKIIKIQFPFPDLYKLAAPSVTLPQWAWLVLYRLLKSIQLLHRHRRIPGRFSIALQTHPHS